MKLLSIVKSLRFQSSTDEQLVKHYIKIKSEAIINSNKPLAAFISALVFRYLCRNMTNKQVCCILFLITFQIIFFEAYKTLFTKSKQNFSYILNLQSTDITSSFRNSFNK